MPLWCAADHSHEEGGQTHAAKPLLSRLQHGKKQGHSRVVRIPPGDSVVLNSAERAPFLIHVEILEGDVDFDPTRRENKELLKKIVVQEDLRKRQKSLGIKTQAASESFSGLGHGVGFGAPMPDVPPEPTAEEKYNEEDVPPSARKAAQPDEVEEMDLVEQLYGAKLSVKDVLPDMSESIPLPNAPKNKANDLLAWDRKELSRKNSAVSTPGLSGPESPGLHAAGGTGVSGVDVAPDLFASGAGEKPMISLEDYSERMRTAAVMLAQLNASMVPTVPEGHTSSSSGGALSWIPGTGWITGSKDQSSTLPNQFENSPNSAAAAGGKLKLAAAHATAIRERIMTEMMALEEERVARMTDRQEGEGVDMQVGVGGEGNTAEDEGIVRRELNKADPSAAVFKESWTAKKARIRSSSPWGHLANWDVSLHSISILFPSHLLCKKKRS